jgi:intraflagellar transport protein 122
LIKDKTGVELVQIKKSVQAVWTLAFCPQKFDTADNILVAGSWDSKLSIYQLSGGKNYKQVGSDKDLGFDPCSIAFYPTGEYMAIGGSDKKMTLWNKDGVLLGTVAEFNQWIWATAVNPVSKNVFAGTNNGLMSVHNIEFMTVHGLYQDRYAYRELMTDVIIQHLVTETRVKIRCRDYIKKIAIYKDRLAV